MPQLPMHAWHPAAVHLPLVALALAALTDVRGAFRQDRGWTRAASWLWAAGLAGAGAAIGSGLIAYNQVDHSDPAHALMTLHRNVAFGAIGLSLAAVGWRWRVPFSRGAALLGLLATVTLGTAGYLGGELVYRHGLGLPNDRLRQVLTERGVAPAGQGSPAKPAGSPSDSAAAPPAGGGGHRHAPGEEH